MKHILLTTLFLAGLASAQTYRTEKVDNVNIFYREAGSPSKPTIVLLHGFPSSSHMYRNLIPILAPHYHVIAPDFPSFGYSSQPTLQEFDYTFANLASITDKFLDQRGIKKYSIYVQDYGSPVGFRLFMKHPERIQAIISQNGNAYAEGLSPFWAEYLEPFWKDRNPTTEAKARQLLTIDTTKLQYTAGFKNPERVDPDAWTFAQATLDRPGNKEIQLALFYDYQTNVKQYDEWHAMLRKVQPPILAVWGKNDPIFSFPGAEAFKRDVPKTELHAIDSGHFALEEEADQIGTIVLKFLAKNVR
ncbi:MAG: alpha/beta hydrolase [Acidobacteria bacterium]|nr:alpha/beta hydrolase [Acidobacteriota bacterium]